MENEILKELWKSKDEVAREHNNDIDSLVEKLREKEKKDKEKTVDLSNHGRAAA